MKTKHVFIALATIAALSVVSCKNAKTSEQTQEEIQAQKQALADSVLVDIDAVADQLYDASSKSFRIRKVELSEKDKMIKPDYLLDFSVANTLATREQKVRALAIYITDLSVRIIYDMPLEENKAVIARLAAETGNYDMDSFTAEIPLSEKARALYEECRANDDLAFFWQMQYGICIGMDAIIAQDPDLFFSQITEEQWQAFNLRIKTTLEAVEELAKYDKEMSRLWEFRSKNRVAASEEEKVMVNRTKETAKQFRVANKDKYLAKRNAFLQ